MKYSKEIYDLTSFLPECFGIKIRTYAISSGISLYPCYCDVCKKKMETVTHFCSKECRNSPKGKQITVERRKQTHIRKYGKWNLQLESTKNQIKQTNLEKYGKEYATQCEKVKNQIKQTSIKKYGFDNPSKSQVIITKIAKTKSLKTQDELNKTKNQIKQTNLEKYGTSCTLHSEKGIQQKKKRWKKKYGENIEHPCQSPIVKNRKEITCLKNLGVKYALQSPIIKNHIRITNLTKHYTEKLLNLKIIKPLFSLEEYKGNKYQYKWQCLECNKNSKMFSLSSKIVRNFYP